MRAGNRLFAAAWLATALWLGCGSDAADGDESQNAATTTGTTTSGGGGSGGTAAPPLDCFEESILGPIAPSYGILDPVYGTHCYGTNHQDITGVEKVVFFGDSITFGTFPTENDKVYRAVLTSTLEQKFGEGIEIANCSENGARVDDLMSKQFPKCFAGPEPKKTLVVMTMGGNDIAAWAGDNLPPDEALAEAQKTADMFRQAIDWLVAPAQFPSGVYVIFGNVYEYTDGTGDLDSCAASGLIGLSGNYINAGGPALQLLAQEYMQTAVQTKTDVIFMLESFCGHGFNREKETAQCYRGPGSALWFDFTCIHPNTAGHAEIAKMFQAVVDE